MNLMAKLLGRTATQGVVWVETAELLKLMDTETPPTIIDVRGPDEFLGPLGHIDTAQNIPLDQIPKRAAELLKKSSSIVLVCHTDRRSAAAAEHLDRLGGTEVAVLRGGMVAWRAYRGL